MKKGFALFCILLLTIAALPALAQSTGVCVDGKTYVITGGDGTYELDGKIFEIDGNTVVVKREGQEDLYLKLEAAEEDVIVVENVPESAATVYADDTVAGNFAIYTFSEDDTAGTRVEVTTSGSQAVSDMVFYSVAESVVEKRSAAVEYSAYAKYGLSYDGTHDLLYYNGRLVRILEDELWVDANAAARLAFFNDAGEVDVRALRDESGELTGLEALSEAEFAARDLTAWTEPSVTRMEMTASDGTELSIEEREAFFAPFAAYGLRYDAERDLLFYRDRQVRKFVDVRVSNGEAMESGKFEGALTQLVYEGGAVDVTTVRDYEHPGTGGEGALLGLTVEEVK